MLENLNKILLEKQAENEPESEPVSEPEIPQIPQNKPNSEPIPESIKPPESSEIKPEKQRPVYRSRYLHHNQ
ncbi:MAG: hypothetical protein AAB510_02310 [Patescibacteria group bacterium]